MQLKCPCCGAVMSLDVLASVDSRELLRDLLVFGDAANLVMKYLGMFRPPKSQLSFERARRILAPLLGVWKDANISRRGVIRSCSQDDFIRALGVVLDRRDEGVLSCPLKSHGYFFEILANIAAGSNRVDGVGSGEKQDNRSFFEPFARAQAALDNDFKALENRNEMASL